MDDKPIDRRKFFRRGLKELINPLAKAIAPLEKMANQIGSMEAQIAKQQEKQPAKPKLVVKPPTRTVSTAPVWLRPPGAIVEELFAKTCTQTGECVNVCPVKCISIDSTRKKGDGLPFIEVDRSPCVVCDGLYCMHACPTGALVPTPLADIDMGTAQWKPATCVRSRGEDCTICVDRCPLGTAAIEVKDNDIHVIADGCIGCGVCEHACPTTPKSIVIQPRVGPPGGAA